MLANSRSPELNSGDALLTYEDEELDDFDDLDEFDDEEYEEELYVGDDFNGNGDFEEAYDEDEGEYTH